MRDCVKFSSKNAPKKAGESTKIRMLTQSTLYHRCYLLLLIYFVASDDVRVFCIAYVTLMITSCFGGRGEEIVS